MEEQSKSHTDSGYRLDYAWMERLSRVVRLWMKKREANRKQL